MGTVHSREQRGLRLINVELGISDSVERIRLGELRRQGRR